ncbi:MAG TPA: AAA family ATPase, partial [Gemmatimonadaceae bacterium]|nr:AAA family ATPase [Gemmatimonadaceae bacterium]
MGTTLARPRAAAHRTRGTSPAAVRQPAPPPAPAHAATAADAPASPPFTTRRSLLRPLGIVGYDAIEPAILAALATEEPLLLISEHGAAKTLLLLRLAEALGLELRHYNASLLQFDDLAGFPIPDQEGQIRYVAPPGAIWEAEVAFFDEIGRCRPDVANKLFPIIHERRIQGLPITRLRHRWAATNPPADAQDASSRFAYEAVEALDPALADRFSWIVALPHFGDFADADRRAIIGGIGEQPAEGAHATVRELVSAARTLIPGIRASASSEIATYVDVLVAKLGAAGIAVGGRRAATLFRNMIAMRAAHLALGLRSDAQACLAAVLASMPDTVRRVIPRATLQAAHEAAWQQVALADDDPLRALLAVRD